MMLAIRSLSLYLGLMIDRGHRHGTDDDRFPVRFLRRLDTTARRSPMRGAIRVLGASLLLAAVASAHADEPTFPGEWRTSLGIATFKMEGDTLVATFANPQISPVKGAVKAKTATLEYREGPKRGDASLTLDDSGRSFSGWYRYGEGEHNYPGTSWNGWGPTPRRPEEKRAGSTASG